MAGCLARGDEAGGSTPGPEDGGSTPGPEDGATPTATAEPTSTPEPTPTPESTAASDIPEPESLQAWLADANGHDDDVTRQTAEDRPDVRVGHDTGEGPAFAPAAIEVPPNTEVTWEWTGHGVHNVVALDGTFDSGRVNGQPGTCYHYFFEEPGEYYFVSEPHAEEGMKGAIVVKEPPSTGYPAVDEWVVDTSNFDGSVADRTGQDRTTVAAGAEGNGGQFAFDPPVLKISPGTTVAWEWTGEGGAHNIEFEEADIASGEVVAESGVHFEHTFEETGIYRYACLPHRALGQVGAVVVE
jgi:halocyanin-like protein